jgi:hypothetical protein
MSLKTSIVVKKDAVIGLTGGSDVTYANNGRGFNGANILVNTGNDNTLTRESITTRSVLGSLAINDKALAKLNRSTIQYREPFTDSKGKVYTGVGGTFELVSHPEQTTANRVAMLARSLAIAGDTELSDFLTKMLDA